MRIFLLDFTGFLHYNFNCQVAMWIWRSPYRLTESTMSWVEFLPRTIVCVVQKCFIVLSQMFKMFIVRLMFLKSPYTVILNPEHQMRPDRRCDTALAYLISFFHRSLFARFGWVEIRSICNIGSSESAIFRYEEKRNHTDELKTSPFFAVG